MAFVQDTSSGCPFVEHSKVRGLFVDVQPPCQHIGIAAVGVHRGVRAIRDGVAQRDDRRTVFAFGTNGHTLDEAGSDLRLRGVDPRMDQLSDLNITNESDHLHLHPDIHYVFIPFDHSAYTPVESTRSKLRIIHSPTNRNFKGTELILPVIERLKNIRSIEFILAEAMEHQELIRLKATCDIAIEQIGNLGGTGYGVNSLETLALGIPTVTEMTPDYVAWLPENPFVLATKDTLLDCLVDLIDHPYIRKQYSLDGRRWVEQYHSYEAVYARLLHLYHEHAIL